jgi:hypothetical protein
VASALAFGVTGLLAESFAKAMHHELDQVAAGFCLKINGPLRTDCRSSGPRAITPRSSRRATADRLQFAPSVRLRLPYRSI